MKEVKIKVPENMELIQEGNIYKLVEKPFKLEIGKDYAGKYHNKICIDRTDNVGNYGFSQKGNFCQDIYCHNPYGWREATKEEIVEAFKKECVRRFGEDWENVKLKRGSIRGISYRNALNCGDFTPTIEKHNCWIVWNKNGIIYYDGEWNKSLEEQLPKSWVELEEEKELAKLKAKFEKRQKYEKWQDKLVQPKDSDYYFITSDLIEGLQVAYRSINLNSIGLYSQIEPKHIFRTIKQAELIKEKMLLMQEMYAFAHVRNEGWLPDWSDINVQKWGIFLPNNIVDISSWYQSNYIVFGVTVKSEEIAKEMVKIFGERIKKYYNVQY